MEITRNKLKQMSLLSATHPSPTEFQTKTFFLPPPAARGGKAARDASDQTCLSPISLCSAAQEQFPKAAAFGSLSWFILSRTRKNEHQNSTANACRRHRVSVKRRSRLSFCHFSYGLAQLRALGKSKDAISLSFHKEMAKETRASNSVFMGK
ncbi:MAG: hypothetical protein IJW09_02620 [Clostridia bacterium]|nr:hypothetical protein [Clostridia bacterium]